MGNQNAPAISGGKIDDIQILRAIAILSVLFYHSSLSGSIVAALPVRISSPFYAGVEMFFVISGFVVIKSLRRGGYEPLSFLIRRIYRLYPPILVFLLVTATVNTAIRWTGYPQYGVNAFCTSAAEFVAQALSILGGYLINRPGATSYMNGAMWSLSVEFQFYAAVTLISIILVTMKLGIRWMDRAMLAVAVLVFAVALAARGALLAGFGSYAGYIFRDKFDFMALGVILAYLPQSWLTKPTPMRVAVLFGPVLLVICLGALALCRTPIAEPEYIDYFEGGGMLVALASFGSLVVLASRGAINQMIPAALTRFMLIVGDRSYTLYLLHFPCMLIAWVFLVALRVEWVFRPWVYEIIQPFATALFLIPLTEFCYRCVELPWNAKGHRAARRAVERRHPVAV
jgi:peptidoglycan/LPS O-acetylase OafA/YrhL